MYAIEIEDIKAVVIRGGEIWEVVADASKWIEDHAPIIISDIVYRYDERLFRNEIYIYYTK